MSKYSKAEQRVMASAFKRVFGCRDEVLRTPAVIEWMESAPVGIVEYDGLLPHENGNQRDRRCEIVDVYDGIVDTLVKHLRRVFPEYRKLQKWEMMFRVYDGITAAKESIEQAISQATFSENGDTGEVPQSKEELQNSQGSSTEESVGVEPFMNPPEPAEDEVQHDTSNVSTTGVHDEPQSSSSDNKPTGNVQEISTEVSSKIDNSIESKEEREMSEIDQMLTAAKGAAGKADPSAVQTMPGKANVTASKGVDSEARAKVADMLASQKDQRNAWTQGHTVTAIISTMQPAALRTTSNMGSPVGGETDPAKALEEINKKINKFIVAVSGQEGITQEAFEALPDDKKYANVVVKDGVDNTGKAAAMYALYKQIKQSPMESIAAYIPDADKVSYPTKGYQIGSTPYPEQEFILQLIDNGMGVIYGEGSMDKDGNDVGEKPVVFKVGIASRQEKAVSTGVSTAKKTSRVPVVRPKNRKEFIKGGQNIIYMFTEVDKENAGSASFKAAINVGGALVGATVSVYALENGKKVQRSVKENGDVTYKTKVASIAVSVPVQKIKREFGAQFRADNEDILVTAGRWGVQLKVDQQKGNFGNITEFSAAPVLDIFANIYSGGVKLSDVLRSGSQSIQALQNAANAQAEQDAKASADELV